MMGIVPKLDMESSYVLVSALRLAQVLFAVVSTAITAYLVGTMHPLTPSPVRATVNFIMFVCALNLVISAYGVASRYVTKLALPMVQLPLDVAGSVFALVGGLVISIKLGLVDCRRAGPKVDDQEWIVWWWNTDPEMNMVEYLTRSITRCRVFQADNAFIYMMFVAGLAGAFLTYRARKSGQGATVRGVV